MLNKFATIVIQALRVVPMVEEDESQEVSLFDKMFVSLQNREPITQTYSLSKEVKREDKAMTRSSMSNWAS